VVLPWDLQEMPPPPEHGQMRAFWVDNADPGMYSREQIDTLIEHSTAININTLFAQVRRHGDAMYTSDLEPRFPGLPPAEAFDPLAYLLERAHAAGIKVHAWIVVSVVCQGNDQAGHPMHVCTHHGRDASNREKWITTTYDGEDVGYLDFGHPAAITHMERVVEDIVTRYPQLDGIHFDYIRYGDKDHGYNAVSLARFREAHGLPADYRPTPSDAAWSQWRRDNITRLVRRLYIRSKAINPQLEVSAATITWGGDGSFYEEQLSEEAASEERSNETSPQHFGRIKKLVQQVYRGAQSGAEPPAAVPAPAEAPPPEDKSIGTNDWRHSAAYRRVFQDWRAWLDEGILDFAVPMNYFDEHVAENHTWYNNWQQWNRVPENSGKRAIVTGLGGWLNNSATNISQIQRALLPDEQGRTSYGVALFDYNEPLADSTWYRRSLYFDLLQQSVFATPAPPPTWPWVATPTTGHIQGVATIRGSVVPGAEVMVVPVPQQRTPTRSVPPLQNGWSLLLGGAEWRTDTTAYADGWYGMVELAPGSYTVLVRDPHDQSRVAVYAVQVQAGTVATVHAPE
jgi:uncharacterized lipoprotein YddW (UPF0748 family)